MSATRMIGGIERPAAGTWSIDPAHAKVVFVGRQFRLVRVQGRFTGIDGTVHIASDPIESRLEVTIDMASVESGSARRDNHLRSADYFDVENHPTAHFRSTAVAFAGTRGTITGELTIKGITRPAVLDFEYFGYAGDPPDNDRAVFSATATLNREDWGVVWNTVLDSGSFLISKQLRLDIDVKLIRQ